MCRSIKTLRRPGEPAVTNEEITAAALQFVRKISGMRKPSNANQPVFDGAVAAVAEKVKSCSSRSRRRATDSPKKRSTANPARISA